MPELPEVETIVRELRDSHLIGKKIRQVKVFWARSIASPTVPEFCSQLVDQTIVDIKRRGKFIVFTLSKDALLIHLRMTGKLKISKRIKEISSHERVQLQFDDGRFLRYDDQRKFGKWYLASSPEMILGGLGLEPLSKEFTLTSFKKLFINKTLPIKPFLLSQHYVAGLGNIYVDEALWEAKIHPLRKVNSLSQHEITALHHAIIKVLKQGIAHMGTSLGNKLANYFSVSGRRGGNQTQLKVFRRDGLSCSRCRSQIIKMTVAQRGTHLCPNCQKN